MVLFPEEEFWYGESGCLQCYAIFKNIDKKIGADALPRMLR
jgi:hypothetical protein